MQVIHCTYSGNNLIESGSFWIEMLNCMLKIPSLGNLKIDRAKITFP